MGEKSLGSLSNSKKSRIVEPGRRGFGVSLNSERGTTQTVVKAPKHRLSVNGGRMSISPDSRGVGLEAAIL